MPQHGAFALSSYRIARAVDFENAPSFTTMTNTAMDAFKNQNPLPPHSSHPDFGHLIVLVLGAVLEVVCVSLPGYIVARQGMFDAEAQKFVANLNTQLFTPCLIFTKLASQLTAEKLVELAIIPVIFIVQTLVSYLCSLAMSKAFGFHKRAQNFVIAMGVFGNSNSLPISLVISLSKTLKGLHWDKIPGDNDDEVAARGILYLLIFQQLGQLLRWTWGFNVLLAPPEKYKEDSRVEEGRYRDSGEYDRQRRALLADYDEESSSGSETQDRRAGGGEEGAINYTSDYGSGAATPHRLLCSDTDTCSCCSSDSDREEPTPTPTFGNTVQPGRGNLAGSGVPNGDHMNGVKRPEKGPKKWWFNIKQWLNGKATTISQATSRTGKRAFDSFPTPVQKALGVLGHHIGRFLHGLWEFMNPPLWAMLAAIVVASVPDLQHTFYTPGTFINTSVTRAIAQSGGVAVPLILVVLGANLARNTLPREQLGTDDPKEERNLLIASLVSRMLLPLILLSPFFAVFAKWVPISILDDPIFVIVCFLLAGAPSALQLAQMCQLNNCYMGAMSRLLFQSYVIWILPSTLLQVMLALEVVEWASR